MILGFLAMFCLFTGLSLLFASAVLQTKHRKIFMISGAVLAIVPLFLLLASLFYPVWD